MSIPSSKESYYSDTVFPFAVKFFVDQLSVLKFED